MKEFINKNSKLLSIIAGVIILIAIIIGIVVYNNNHLTITYLVDDDEYKVVENIKKGQTVDSPKAPTKEGYTFEGWYLDDEKFDFDNEIKSKIVLKARFTINKYNVAFVNTFAETKTETVEWNKKVSKPADPTAYGYTFTGWYSNYELYNFDTPVKEDLTLTAGWYRDTVVYTVNHYKMNDDGEYEKEASDKDSAYGYVGESVSGTLKEYKGYKQPDKKSIILGYNTNNIDYYYDIRFFNIDVVGDNGVKSTSGSGKYKYQDKVEIGYELKPGYTLKNITPELTDGKYIVENEDKTIDVITKPIEYKINLLNVDGAKFESVNPSYYTVESSKMTLVNPTKEGYDFAGWSTKEDATTGDMEVVIDPSELKDVTYYATWVDEDREYTIEYELDNGELEEENPTKYDKNTETFTLNNPYKENYDFVGWKDSITSEPVKEYTIKKGSKGDLKLMAVFTPTKFTITYDLDGGNATNPEEYTIETETFTLANPTKEGYYFKGWLSGQLVFKEYSVKKGSFGDIELTALWAKYKFTLTNIGEKDDELFVDEGENWSTIVIPDPEDLEGYKFDRWCLDENCDEELPEQGEIDDDQTLYAQWNQLYTITYLFGEAEGNPDSYIDVTEEDRTIVLNSPVDDERIFSGWYNGTQILPIDQETGTTTYVIPEGSGNITLVAMWEPTV